MINRTFDTVVKISFFLCLFSLAFNLTFVGFSDGYTYVMNYITEIGSYFDGSIEFLKPMIQGVRGIIDQAEAIFGNITISMKNALNSIFGDFWNNLKNHDKSSWNFLLPQVIPFIKVL